MKHTLRILYIAGALAMPAAAHAELTRLELNLVPDDRTLHPGDSIAVTASGDDGLNLQYRFLIQRHDGTAFVTVTDSGWGASASTAVDTASGSWPDANYRLVAQVRETARPTDFLASHVAFSYGPLDESLCDYLDGKTFINETPSAASIELGSVSMGEALSLLSAPGLELALASKAHAITSLSFSDGTVSATTFNPNSFSGTLVSTFSTPFAGEATLASPLTGSYSCDGDEVTIDATGASTSITGSGMVSLLAGLGISEVHFQVTGDATADRAAGTLTAGDTVFVLPGSGEESADDSDGGAFGLIPLLALLLLRRNQRPH